MHRLSVLLFSLAALQACGPQGPTPADPMAACSKAAKRELLNPETAEFYDLKEIDKDTYNLVVESVLSEKYNYPAGRIMIDNELVAADSTGRVYRVRVRSEGRLGNKITTFAYCRMPVEIASLCFCTIQP